jgi:cytochrome c oxidase subunit 2
MVAPPRAREGSRRVTRLPLFPEQASTVAGQVDALLFFLLGISVFFTLLIAGLIIVFMVRYRRRPENVDYVPETHGSLALEGLWTAIPFGIAMVIFFWAASIFATIHRAPDDAIPIDVVGKQWMWKLQHMEGKREINELHIPVGRPVKLTMTSEDVIHSFYVPAFRVKQDAVPGRYTALTVLPTRVGTYELHCSEYCGTDHARMGGKVVVMAPAAFSAWLSNGNANASLAAQGFELFRSKGCSGCHVNSTVHAPDLVAIYGRTIHLADGRSVVADEAYLRDSILLPKRDVVAGYEPIMPSFQGQLSESEIAALVSYLKSR